MFTFSMVFLLFMAVLNVAMYLATYATYDFKNGQQFVIVGIWVALTVIYNVGVMVLAFKGLGVFNG